MSHYKILVVDYEPRGIAQLRDPLHACGYSVTVVSDGLTAMRVFDELKPDLTLIEAMLPKKHGFEVCQELKQTSHGASSPVVIVTSVYKGRKYRTLALHNYRCDEYLEKPVSAATLLSTVERLLKARETVAESPPGTPAAEPEQAAPAPADPPSAQAKPVEDEAESEISRRLDELLGGDTSEGPKASAPDGENVLSFELVRTRKPEVVSPSESVGPETGGGVVRRVHAPGGAVAIDHARPTVGVATPDSASKRAPEPQRRTAPRTPVPDARPRRSRRLVLLVTLLVLAITSTALFLLYWPW